MANRFWVGGTAAWDGTAGTKWSTTSGGAGGAAVPTAADDVFLDAASGAVTVTISTATALCRSLTCTGFTGTLAHATGISLLIGDASGGALTFSAGMTYTPSGSASSGIQFRATSTNGGAGWPITTAGKTMGVNGGTIKFNGAGGKWVLQDNFSSDNGNILQHTDGELDTNSKTLSIGAFQSTGANTRVLTLGSSAITVLSGTPWNVRFTSLTVTTNTAVVTANGSAATLTLASTLGGNYNGMSFVLSGPNTMVIIVATGTATTVANLTRTGTALRTDGLNINGDLTISGTLTLTGNSDVNRMWLRSSASGTARTLTVNGSVVASNCDFTDITGAGSASWNLSAITGGSGDAQGNSGITFTTAATQTRTGAGSTWSDAAKWTSRVPLAQDDVIVGSGASGTVTLDVRFFGHNLDLTGFTGSIPASGVTTVYLWGNLTLDPGGGLVSAFSSTIVMAGRGSQTLTSNGRSMTQGNNRDFTFGLNPGLGSVTLVDDADIRLGSTSQVNVNNTLALNGKTLHGRSTSATALPLQVLSGATLAGPGTLQWEGTVGVNVLYDVATGAIVTGTPDIVLASTQTTGAIAQVINGGGKSYGILSNVVAGATSSLAITGANTFQDIRFSDASNARTLILPSGTITQILATHGLASIVGTAGKLMTVKSSTGGSPATLALPNGFGGGSDYLSVQDITASTNPWYAGSHSTNVSGNTNVVFTAAPATTKYACGIGVL